MTYKIEEFYEVCRRHHEEKTKTEGVDNKPKEEETECEDS